MDYSNHRYVKPRFRLHADGDYICNDDFAVFDSVKFRGKQLTVTSLSRLGVEASSETDTRYTLGDHMVGLSRNKYMKNGWQMIVVSSYIFENKVQSMDSRSRTVCGGDYIRLKHRQSRGVLTSRANYYHELKSAVAPLGLITRKSARARSQTHAVVVELNHSEKTMDRYLSGPGVWQIILDSSRNGFGHVMDGSHVRLQNVLSGQLLCIRTFSNKQGDDEFLKSSAYLNADGSSDTSHILATTDVTDKSSLFKIMSIDTCQDSSNDIDFNILFSRNTYFVHCESQMTIGVESRKNTISSLKSTENLIVRPVDITAAGVNRGAFTLEKVALEEVQDILFISKFHNIILKCIHAIQNHTLDNLYLPLYRHLNVSLHTLIMWLNEPNFQPDASLIPAKKTRKLSTKSKHRSIREMQSEHLDVLSDSDEKSIHGEIHEIMRKRDLRKTLDKGMDENEYIEKDHASSLGIWLGLIKESSKDFDPEDLDPDLRASAEFHHVFVDNREKRGRILDHHAETRMKRRQGLIKDTTLIEMMLHYNGIVYALVQTEKEKLNVERLQGVLDAEKSLMEKKYRVPKIIRKSCITVYNLVKHAVRGNAANADHILSISGMFMTMINHEVSKLSPPIETILLSAQSLQAAHVISTYDIQHLLKQMFEQLDTAQNILSLLSVLCSASGRNKIANRRFQDIALQVVFHAAEVCGELSGEECRSLLFSSRFNSTSQAWEIMLRPSLKLHEAEVAREDLIIALEQEFNSLLNVFFTYNVDDNDILDEDELTYLLEDLGLGGASLEDELCHLLEEDCDVATFICWCWRKRRLHFSTASTLLNALSVQQSYDYLFGSTSLEEEIQLERRRAESNLNDSNTFEEALSTMRDEEDHRFDGEDIDSKVDEDSSQNDESEEEYESLSSAKFPAGYEPLNHLIEFKKNDIGMQKLKAKVFQASSQSAAHSALFKLRTINTFKKSLKRSSAHEKECSLDASADDMSATNVVVGGGGATLGYSGVSLRLDTDFKTAEKKLNEVVVSKNSHTWERLDVVVSKAGYEREWLRQALIFLTNLCRGNNIISQISVSRLVPAEFLLSLMLNPHVDEFDKYIVCDLMRCVFVENDLVFPRLSRRLNDLKLIGVDEFSELRDTLVVTAGKVFNVFSRANFECGYRESAQLRNDLLNFVQFELKNMNFTPQDSKEKILYDGCLLNLTRSLMHQGFFEGLQRDNEREKQDNEQEIKISDIFHVFDHSSQIKYGLKSNIASNRLEHILIEKLQLFLASLSVESKSVNKDRARDDRHNPSKGFSFDIGDDCDSEDVHRFNTSFNNALRVDSIRELMKCLVTCFNIQQINSLRELSLKLLAGNNQFYWLNDDGRRLSGSTFAAKAESFLDDQNDSTAEIEDLRGEIDFFESDADVENLGLQFLSANMELIDKTFREVDAKDEEYVKAVLTASLFKSVPLQHDVYELLNRQLFPKRDAAYILRSIKLVPTEEEAHVCRLVAVFTNLLKKHLPSLASYKGYDTSIQRTIAIKYIDFCLNGIRSLCFLRLRRERSTRAGGYSAYDPVSGMKNIVNNIKNTGVGLTSKLMTWARKKMVQTLMYEPTPNDEDGIELSIPSLDAVSEASETDFFDENLESKEGDNIESNVDNELDDLELFSVPVFDCSPMLKEIVHMLCDALLRIFSNDEISMEWKYTDQEERNFLDIVGNFLLRVCFYSEVQTCLQNITTSILPDFFNFYILYLKALSSICAQKLLFVREYVLCSSGAQDIFTLCCRHSAEKWSRSNIKYGTLRQLMENLVDWRGKEDYKIVQVFISILQNQEMPLEIGEY